MAAHNVKITKKDAEIISYLRNNARNKITIISKAINSPATTIYDKVKSHEKKGIIKKSVALIDFAKIGYSSTAFIALKANGMQRNELQQFLAEHPNVNSLYRTGIDNDFVAECIFSDQAVLQDFIESIQQNFNIDSPKVYSIIQEIKKEDFLTNPGHLEGDKNDA